MNPSLTQADVVRLLADPSPDVRAEVAVKIAGELDNSHLTEKELLLAQDLARVMARDVALAVRAALSEGLRRATRVPHDVALRLASDVEAVALPILADSIVLTDDDLVAIVRQGSATKQEAIAGRRDVAEPVAEALIAIAPESAVTVLLGNAGAKVNERGLGVAIDRFGASRGITETMARREQLPVSVAERLVTLVSDQLREYLVSHHDLSPTIASDIVLQSRERTIINLSLNSDGDELGRMVAQMHRNGRLTPTLILRSLCMGDLAFFETALAVMANVTAANARILINDAGENGMLALWDRSGLPKSLLPIVRTALDVLRGTSLDGGAHDIERFRARVITRILTQFEDFGTEDLDYLVNKLGDAVAAAAA
jgi:uncharacterized protein (DUF2336 family)